MEKNGNRCPLSVCEKIFKAASSDYSRFRAIRRASSCKQDPNPSKPLAPPTPSLKAIKIRQIPKAIEPSHQRNTFIKEEAAQGTPINHASSATLQPEKLKTTKSFSLNQNNTSQVTKVASKKPTFKVESLEAEDEEYKKTGGVLDIEDRFSDYINRARKRIGRTISNMGDGMKMGRSMSNIGDGKKPSGRDRFSEYIDRTKMRIRRSVTSIGGGS